MVRFSVVSQVLCCWSGSLLLIRFYVVAQVLSGWSGSLWLVMFYVVDHVLCCCVVFCWSGSPLLIRLTDVWSSVVNQCFCPLVLCRWSVCISVIMLPVNGQVISHRSGF